MLQNQWEAKEQRSQDTDFGVIETKVKILFAPIVSTASSGSITFPEPQFYYLSKGIVIAPSPVLKIKQYVKQKYLL